MAKLKKIIATNRRARYDYQFEQLLVAGLELSGQEVKSIRGGNVDLKGAYITIQNNEAFVLNMHVKAYSHAKTEHYQPDRTRKLLLHKNEIQELIAAKQNGRTIVATAIGLQNNYIKLEIAIARGKKAHDKRRTIKERDQARDTRKIVR